MKKNSILFFLMLFCVTAFGQNTTEKSQNTIAPDERVFDVVEVQPTFPGGQGALMQWISDNIKYPVTAAKNGVPLDLTQKEFDLLRFLMAEPDKVFSREALMEQVWNYGYYGDMRTVDVTIRRLREKIEDDPSKPRHILTKRGVGYYFVR